MHVRMYVCLDVYVYMYACMYVGTSWRATEGQVSSCTCSNGYTLICCDPVVQAIELDGSIALPHIAACTSMGRLALLSDNKTKVRLAHDAREEAVIALALEPGNDLAHHLMGRWHYEMANLNVVVRTLVRVMYGTSLAPGMALQLGP